MHQFSMIYTIRSRSDAPVFHDIHNKNNESPTLYTTMLLFQASCVPTKPTVRSTLVVASSEASAEMLSHAVIIWSGCSGARANRLATTVCPDDVSAEI